MKIIIEDKEYTITDKIFKETLDFFIQIGFLIYDGKTPGPVQAVLEGLARAELYGREKKEPDKKDYFRPIKRESFVKHLASIMKDDMIKDLESTDQKIGLKDQRIGLKTNENGEIVSIEFQNPSAPRGPLVAGGDVG